MVMKPSESRRERSEERYRSGSPVTEGASDHLEELDQGKRESSKHRSKDKKKSRKEEKDHKTRAGDQLKNDDESREKEANDFEKERLSSRGRRREEKEQHEKDRSRDKEREKDYDRDRYRGKDHEKDRDRKDRGKDRDSERNSEMEFDTDRGREKDRGKGKSRDNKDKERDRDAAKDRDRTRDKEREKDIERHRDREKDREHWRDRDREPLEREKGKHRFREGEAQRSIRIGREDAHDRNKDGATEDKPDIENEDSKEEGGRQEVTPTDVHGMTSGLGKYDEATFDGRNQNKRELEERILKMKEERLRKKSEGSEVLSWVNRSRIIEEKRNVEKQKAIQLSRIFDEQAGFCDNIGEEDIEEDVGDQQTADALAGVKVLHGLDKVIEGGSVVLTLKDQEILANGDINEDVDMLENVEIGEQKRRDDAYKAAKKKTGIYNDKFNDEPGSEKKMLPQYDDPTAEEGVTLDASGRFTGAAEKKLDELRKRLMGTSVIKQVEDLNSTVKIASDYYTHEEMLQFKKPKKKKSLRRKDKLDIDALEAEAISAGLGVDDLGSRTDAKRQRAREEEERSEAERRISAYQAAYDKADEASRALRVELAGTVQTEEVDTPISADDAEDLEKSLERARKLALKKQNQEIAVGPEAIARIASSTVSSEPTDGHIPASGESLENKVVFTEMEEFVWGLQLDEETSKPSNEDVFMEEDEAPKAMEKVARDDADGWTEVKESETDAQQMDEDEKEVVPDETIHEAPVGKGLSGALKLLKDRGSLKETVEWGGRNMDKKKSKLVGISEEDGPNIERRDEYGRSLTPKEAFRLLSHKFHGKTPGKMKLEKRQKQYQDELKLKRMKNSDTPSQSVERMRETQARLKTPYVVLSGHVKPGQSNDPGGGFATVEKDVPGGLTPMLGDKKVEHFLGIKRKAEPSNLGIPKKPKT
ncbi:ESCRT II complex subunit Dot2 [Dionaea muscipula]